MKLLSGRRGLMIGAVLGYALLALTLSVIHGVSAAPNAASSAAPEAVGPTAFNVPTYSSPIAMSSNNAAIWVVNPDDDSVSIINPSTDTVINKVPVGDEPQSVALDATGAAYIANAASNDVTIIDAAGNFVKTLTTGAEPWNIVASPDGNRVFVANSGQDTITVIRTSDHTIVGSVNLKTSACNLGDPERHFQPRGMAVTLNSQILYVTRFFSFTAPGGKQATDNGKVGVVCRIELPAAINTLPSQFTPITMASQDTGFTAKIADLDTPTRAYPNQLQSIVIHGDQAYLPNIAASPAGPLKFNVDTQAFVNVLDNVNGTSTATVDASATKFLNLHLGARDPEPGKTKLFFANPWAIAFTNPNTAGGSAYVVSAGSDLLVKVNVSGTAGPTLGKLSFTVDANTTRYIDLDDPNNPATSGANAGKNPLGIVIRNISPTDKKAYVMNYVSRSVSVVNLVNDTVAKVLPLTDLPDAGTQDEQLQAGKEVFFSSRGVFDGGKVNRLSSEGWQNCASCHFAGLTDGNVWSFNAGPRKAVPLNGTWNPHDPDDQRALNYSAIFDEVQDFEANIRNVSGPGNLPAPAPANTLDPNHGLLIGDDGNINNAPGVVNAFLKPNAGRPQLTVTLPASGTHWPALDALKEWVRFAVRTPNAPLTDSQISAGNGGISQSAINSGRVLFFKAGCQTCHGGGKWSNSIVDFTPPPAGTELATEVAGPLPPPGGSPAPPAGVTPVGAQFLFNKLQDIGSFNLGVAGATPPNPIGTNVGAPERAATANKADANGLLALGKDHNLDKKGEGFNVPSLLGTYASPPYYHNGACETLACVVSDVNHRRKGLRTGQTDPINAGNQASLVAFLQSIDANTKPTTNLYVNKHDIFLDPAAPIATQVVTPGVYLSVFGPGVTFAPSINVKFTLSRFGSSTPVKVETVQLAAFTRDFGQERVVAPPITLPAQAGLYRLEVFVDSDDTFVEDKENDNKASRTFFVKPPPPDKTAPVISNVAINNDAVVTTSRDVTVKFDASDPGQPSTGVETFCIVRYYYNVVLRRWVEETCDFKQLPQASPPGTFTVNTTLPNRPGVAYTFVWVKDKAGNISKIPGFDFINFIPSGQQQLDHNDALVFRIRLGVSQGATFTVTPISGDVDTTVFQGITNPQRCDISAIRNGLEAETVTIPSVSCPGLEFQIEVRAVVNSKFTIAFTPTTAAAARAAASAQAIGPQDKPALADDTPLVGGPPEQQSAIDAAAPVFLPITTR